MIQSSPHFNVHLESFEVSDGPARVTFYYRVGAVAFWTEITYQSLQSWSQLPGWDSLEFRHELLGVIAAWDGMRFLGLGGEVLDLGDTLTCSSSLPALWKHSILRQMGEWRYRNQLIYRHKDYPLLRACDRFRSPGLEALKDFGNERYLVTNGGGKDTLVGMLLLQMSGIRQYDLYEGYLPFGGDIDQQKKLLARLRDLSSNHERRVVTVLIADNFYDFSDQALRELGVEASFYKTDFSVGHTANYIGYLPLILAHRYSEILFHIEASADRAMVVWKDEPISHQWCKSQEYHRLITSIVREHFGVKFFKGFVSTLHALHDLAIYRIASQHPALLRRTHSCNYEKPWCNRCPKCCFCYLLMSAYVDEHFAQEVVGVSHSLFEDNDLHDVWVTLLDRSKVAWECVPSHEECLVAATMCVRSGSTSVLLKQFELSDWEYNRLRLIYEEINEESVPSVLLPSFARLKQEGII